MKITFKTIPKKKRFLDIVPLISKDNFEYGYTNDSRLLVRYNNEKIFYLYDVDDYIYYEFDNTTNKELFNNILKSNYKYTIEKIL